MEAACLHQRGAGAVDEASALGVGEVSGAEAQVTTEGIGPRMGAHGGFGRRRLPAPQLGASSPPQAHTLLPASGLPSAHLLLPAEAAAAACEVPGGAAASAAQLARCPVAGLVLATPPVTMAVGLPDQTVALFLGNVAL